MGDVRDLFKGQPPNPEDDPGTCRAVHALLITQYSAEECDSSCNGLCGVETSDGTPCDSVAILSVGVYPPFSDEVVGPFHVCSDDGHIDFVTTVFTSKIVEHEVGISIYDKIMETGKELGLEGLGLDPDE